MEEDLNRIGIACVSDLYNTMTKKRGDVEYDIITKKYEERGIPQLSNKTIIYLRRMAEWMDTRCSEGHGYY